MEAVLGQEEAFKPLRCPGEASEDWQQNRGGEGR